MQDRLTINDYERKKVIDIDYENGDLLKIIRDVVEIGVVGDMIELRFKYDTINAERLRNFLAIAELYEYTRNRPN